MTPERWQQIKSVLQEALELAPSERSAFLDRCCSSDASLKEEVKTLLSSSEEACSSFLENSPLQVTLVPGTKLGEYEVRKLIGSGGMGEVYRARDLRLRRDVAIKVLPSFLSSDKERLRRFEQEAQAAAALNHPNILAVFQMGTHQKAPYLVSELLHGETLRIQIKRGALPARKAIDYGVQIAHGLAAAHEKGVVHRDLKPENLFSTKDGRIKILDFGLAKLKLPTPRSEYSGTTLGEGTEPGMVMGTVGYMSPEQVRGKDVDYRTDIFAFGAILYEMLTGKRAFQKATAVDTMSAILNEEPSPISQITPNIPPALQRTVHRCLEKSPQQRFQSATDLAFALEALSDSAITPSSKVATPPSAMPRWRALGLAVAAAGLLTAGLIWWWTPPLAPRVEGVRQLTDDGEQKQDVGGLASDGLRIYFNEGRGEHPKLVQVSVSGGQTAPLPMRFPFARLQDLAPGASSLLVSVTASGNLHQETLWMQPLPGGEPRSLGNESGNGSYLPDGRILIARGSSFFIAEKDGLSSQKLTDVPGQIQGVAVSPDGKHVRFTLMGDNFRFSIWEINSDGTGLHTVLKEWPESMGEVIGGWALDGKYFLFQSERGGIWDIWALPEDKGLFHRSSEPVRLTNGPLSYATTGAIRNGRQLFAIGSKKRGELVRYDAKLQMLVPYLSGVSAVASRVSRDGKWIIYISYPDHTLWRTRGDGSERIQLTFPPMMVYYPEISPDGERVAFTGFTPSSGPGLYVLNMGGGTPERVVDFGHASTWSSDGNSLAFDAIVPGKHLFDEGHWCEIHTIDLRSKRISIIPSSENRYAPWWPQPAKILASGVEDGGKPHVFDFKTTKWLQVGNMIDLSSWTPSRDGNYLYLLYSGRAGPVVQRIRGADFKIDTVADLKGVRLLYDNSLEQADSGISIGIAADGSVALTREVGSDEIYALDVKWP